ncbi:hypothetical protein TSAR_000639 [Trichomalopsis sarcophagae]|uniref:Proteasome inhibitor PI31 subunit n=1 Tax=Trichomalopsis sarcophagae TaxID=543379 RepID=A0A232EUZ2_9HYME|nr:hypothetical protein TSAR_000639 [Trichomalopsis sarcophagae]
MASDTANNTFGFELLHKVSAAQISKKEDVLILLVHWHFVKNGYKCLGIGDSKTIGPDETGTELLPDGWNQAPNYTLRYVKEGKLYILIGTKSEADLLLNLLRIEDHSVSNIQFPIDTVQEIQGSLETMIPTYDTLLNLLKKELVEPVYTGTGREVSTQTSESERPGRINYDDPLRVGASGPTPPRPPGSLIPGRPLSPDRFNHAPYCDRYRPNPLEIGRNDLDPFSRGGGGMIFDPFAQRRGPQPPFPGLGVPGRLPPGAVPPGARFDPFGPPDVDPPNPRGRAPDADHMPPPGYDDMFM